MRQINHDGDSRDELKQFHSVENIKSRLAKAPQQSYLRDFVYGGMDGAVTTFAVVSGVAGASLSTEIVLILGIANLVGDGFSMAAGNYLGTRAEKQERAKYQNMEKRHIENYPEGEKEEIRQIFRGQGFTGADLERIVEIISADEKVWIETMLKEEHGLSLTERSPWKAATSTLIAFLVVGLIPLLPFLFTLLISDQKSPQLFSISVVLTGVAFMGIGAMKSLFVDENWYSAAIEALLIGGGAASLAYLCGYLLAFLA